MLEGDDLSPGHASGSRASEATIDSSASVPMGPAAADYSYRIRFGRRVSLSLFRNDLTSEIIQP